jgi:hypothetical protein
MCLLVAAQPGRGYSLGDVTAENTGSDGESISLQVIPVTTALAASIHQVPAPWVASDPPR